MSALFGIGLGELSELDGGARGEALSGAAGWDALYRQRVGSVEVISALPAALREGMAAEGLVVGRPVMAQTAASVDGTGGYLMRMVDGKRWRRFGCRRGTAASGGMGVKRRRKRRGRWRRGVIEGERFRRE